MYLDANTDRRIADARAEHAIQIETMRAAWIYAHDDKQYRSWRAETNRRAGRLPSKGLAQLIAEHGATTLAERTDFRAPQS